MYLDKRIAVVIPALNEIGKIESVIERIPRDLVDLIIVSDDGSSDQTRAVSENLGAIVISNDLTQGVGLAIQRGYFRAAEMGAEIICVLAGNNKDYPENLLDIIEPIANDGYMMVQGSRYLHESSDFGPMPSYRILATKAIHPLLCSVRTRRKLTDTTNGFRAINSSILESSEINFLHPLLNKYAFEPYFLIKTIKLKKKFKEVSARKVYPEKKLGQTKMKPILGWWSILWPTIIPYIFERNLSSKR